MPIENCRSFVLSKPGGPDILVWPENNRQECLSTCLNIYAKSKDYFAGYCGLDDVGFFPHPESGPAWCVLHFPTAGHFAGK
jgi:hypothetical protein